MFDKNKIREYIACPQYGDDHYGKWGALTLEQRDTIRFLLDLVDLYERGIENQIKDIEGRYISKDKIQDKIKELEELLYKGEIKQGYASIAIDTLLDLLEEKQWKNY